MFQRTVDYPNEWANGHHVMLDNEVRVTVRWDRVESSQNEGRWQPIRLQRPRRVSPAILDLVVVTRLRNEEMSPPPLRIRHRKFVVLQMP